MIEFTNTRIPAEPSPRPAFSQELVLRFNHLLSHFNKHAASTAPELRERLSGKVNLGELYRLLVEIGEIVRPHRSRASAEQAILDLEQFIATKLSRSKHWYAGEAFAAVLPEMTSLLAASVRQAEALEERTGDAAATVLGEVPEIYAQSSMSYKEGAMLDAISTRNLTSLNYEASPSKLYIEALARVSRRTK